MPVPDKDQLPRISNFLTVLDSNACGSNYGEMIVKHYHCVLKQWIQTIKVSASIDRKALLIFYGFTSHLKIDMIKDLVEMVWWS